MRVQTHILCISFLGAFDKKATTELSKILETNLDKLLVCGVKESLLLQLKADLISE
jgi:hypothetical protein